jgi:hypothetical protein
MPWPGSTAPTWRPPVPSTTLEDQRATVARTLALVGRHLDIGQGDVAHVVLADPDGNEFCVLPHA